MFEWLEPAIADREYLRKLAAAVVDVKNGKAKARVIEGRREYLFDGFSLLLSAK